MPAFRDGLTRSTEPFVLEYSGEFPLNTACIGCMRRKVIDSFGLLSNRVIDFI